MENNDEQKNDFFNKQFIESAGIGVIIMDASLKYRIWNPYMEKLTGYTASQVIGNTPFESFPGVSYLNNKKCLEKLLEFGTSVTFDFEFNFQETGKKAWVSNSSVPLYNNERKIVGIISTVVDISKRKKTEESLLISKRKLRQVIDLVPQYIYAKDKEGRFILANQAVANLYSIPVKKVIGQIDQVFGNKENKLIKEYTDEAGRVVKEEIVVVPNGRKRILETIRIPFKAIDKTYAELSISIDVTQQKADIMLMRKLIKAVEQSANDIVITDTHGRIEYSNPKFCEGTGYSEEEIKGLIPDFLFTKEVQSIQISKLWDTINTNKIWEGELCKQTKAGNYLWSHSTVVPIEDEQGITTNFLAVGEDITAIRENEIQLKTIINSIPELIIYKDGKKNWLGINKAAASLIGLEGTSYKGKRADELSRISKYNQNIISASDLSDEMTFLNNAPFIFEKIIPLPNGELKTYELKKVPVFNDNGSRKGIVVIGRDITESIKKSNKLIKAKESAEQNNRLKTVFLQNISHEIRTPMNAIIGFSKMLEQSEISREKQEQFTSIITKNCNQLLSVVTNILTISSLETHQMVVFRRKVNINEMLNDLCSNYQAQAQKKGLTLKFNKTLTDEESEIYTDRSKLKQILINLLNNALKFTNKGFIEFGYKLSPALFGSTQKELIFYVKDTGIGIEKEWQGKIFDRFVQLELSENRKYGGNGIGLSISKGFVELLGGKVWVESKKGYGSCFYFTIPYKTTEQPIIGNSNNELFIQGKNPN